MRHLTISTALVAGCLIAGAAWAQGSSGGSSGGGSSSSVSPSTGSSSSGTAAQPGNPTSRPPGQGAAGNAGVRGTPDTLTGNGTNQGTSATGNATMSRPGSPPAAKAARAGLPPAPTAPRPTRTPPGALQASTGCNPVSGLRSARLTGKRNCSAKVRNWSRRPGKASAPPADPQAASLRAG